MQNNPGIESQTTEPPFPRQLRTAAILWMVCGVLIILDAAFSIALPLIHGSAPDSGGVTLSLCPQIMFVLLGVCLIHLGVQCSRRTISSTLGAGPVSIFIGIALILLGGIIAAAAYDAGSPAQVYLLFTGHVEVDHNKVVPPANIPPEHFMMIGGFTVLIGIGLLIAGYLAIASRKQYQAWRHWKNERWAN